MQEQDSGETPGPSQRRVKITVLVTQETKDRIKELGKKDRRSVSSYVEGVIEKDVGRAKR